MLKPYSELSKLNIDEYLSERDGLKYLNWARCVQLLHENGAEKVYFEPIVNEKGSSLFMTDIEYVDKNKVVNRCYEVGVHIVIDDLAFDMRGALMNGTNPVKDNSMSQQRIWNCQTRLFVKGVALMTGLGFYLWTKNELEEEINDKAEDIYSHNILAIKERIQQKVTELMDKGISLSEIAEQTKIGCTDDDVKDIFRNMHRIYNFENLLKTVEVTK